MTVAIDKLRGMPVELAAALKRQGLNSADKFLEKACTPVGRKTLAQSTGVELAVILDMANRADLARIKGIGVVFSDLLEEAGVDTVKELAVRNADNLYAKLAEVNQGRRLAGRLPTAKAVNNWVEQAKALPKLLEY